MSLKNLYQVSLEARLLSCFSCARFRSIHCLIYSGWICLFPQDESLAFKALHAVHGTDRNKGRWLAGFLNGLLAIDCDFDPAFYNGHVFCVVLGQTSTKRFGQCVARLVRNPLCANAEERRLAQRLLFPRLWCPLHICQLSLLVRLDLG